MNKHMHRIIFNHKRGQMMVVAECATADGKSPGVTRRPARRAGSLIAVLRPLAFSTLVMLGLVTLVPSMANAQIVAYRNAPVSQQATVLNAANGVPLVNIQTPSAAGVSHNAYSQFDVQQQGAILNNARTNTQTQLGGWVQGNPWLATGTARVIVNEVVSSNPSSLNGTVEVAGNSAQVVIANPAGVTCDGCGFINASRATVTTGTPVINGGKLEGYRVEGGTVTVQGAGMDASGTSQTDLIARAVKINAGLWAKDLRVSTGANQVDADNAQATPIAASGKEPAPGFAIDVAQLGGMYAGKIKLVGTEAGVGVRNAGQIGASAGDVVLTADGRLVNSGHIESSGQTRVDNVAGIDNSGTIYARNDLALSARDDIDNRGMIAAQGNATLTATGAAGRIANRADATLAAGLAADGTLGTTGNLELTAAQVSTQGQTLAAGDQTLTARELDLADSRISATNVRLTATAGDIDARRAQITASSALADRAARDL
ncbi:MAG: filamentous hemagglutinin N-terminal domain-containing protein, partial [Propionivibrio sp.]